MLRSLRETFDTSNVKLNFHPIQNSEMTQAKLQVVFQLMPHITISYIITAFESVLNGSIDQTNLSSCHHFPAPSSLGASDFLLA